MPTMSQYVDVKSWDRVDITQAAFRGEVHKRGALVPERYLDDTRERLACRLKLMCRCRCLPILERIANEREWEPGWDRCLMCGNGESESIEHFVLRCGAYDNPRQRMLERVAMCGLPTEQLMRVLLGCNTDSREVEDRIDHAFKRFLKRAWRTRKHLTRALNIGLGRQDVIDLSDAPRQTPRGQACETA